MKGEGNEKEFRPDRDSRFGILKGRVRSQNILLPLTAPDGEIR
jgi:hypothetical protein